MYSLGATHYSIDQSKPVSGDNQAKFTSFKEKDSHFVNFVDQ